ncbi:MAG: B12-binding domain-containing radical SAM protein [Candidatus Peribacteraceae bacterium]|jgi:radical SAM superfamily enzyme YgiQ (UPF0313 family)
MKILASFAPSQDVKDRFFSTTPTSLGWAIASLIEEIDLGNLRGFEYVPKIFDPLRVMPGVWDRFQTIVCDEKPDVLLLSSTYDSHFSAIQMGSIAKQNNPEMLIVYGGPHIDEVTSSHVMQVMPQIYPFNETVCPFDILIRGDGELVLLHLMRELSNIGSTSDLIRYLFKPEAHESFALVPGDFAIHVRRDRETHVISGSSLPLDISKLPIMPRKMFSNDLDLYGFSCFQQNNSDGTVSLLPSTSTMLHRGCKSFCLFCSERGGYSARNNAHIEAELDELAKAGIKGVFFDDSTLGDHEEFGNLVDILKIFPLQYGSLNRFDALQDPFFVEKLADTGFVYQYCAIEQLDKSVLKMVAKGQRIETICRGITNLKASGIKLGTSLLFGLPGETPDSISATMDYVAELDRFGILSCVSMSLYSYHPNTPLTLGTREGNKMHHLLQYDREPPNQGAPWHFFEEGQWFHPNWVTSDCVEYIYRKAQELIGHRLVRNMYKDGSTLL